MLILDIEVLFPGNEVGHKIGSSTNTDNKSQLECVTTSNTSTATSYQTSNNNRLLSFCVNYPEFCFRYIFNTIPYHD